MGHSIATMSFDISLLRLSKRRILSFLLSSLLLLLGFCVNSLSKDGKGGGKGVTSSITSEDVDHWWQLEDLPRIQYKEH